MTGLAATSAPYVMRFDADDLLEAGAVGALVGALEAQPHAAAAWGDFETFGQTTFRVPTAPALDPWLVTYVNCIPGAGCLFRRTALVEAGGWRLLEGHEDWDLWMSLAERGYSGVYLSQVVFRDRRDVGGRLAASLTDTDKHYAELRRLHERLFSSRQLNRSCSKAPLALKAAVSCVELLPGVAPHEDPALRAVHASLVERRSVHDRKDDRAGGPAPAATRMGRASCLMTALDLACLS